MQTEELLRQYIVDLLLNADIKYYHDGKVETVLGEYEKRDLMMEKYAELSELKRKRKLKNEVFPIGVDNTDYNTLIEQVRSEIDSTKTAKTISININSSLEEVADQIRNLDKQELTLGLKENWS